MMGFRAVLRIQVIEGMRAVPGRFTGRAKYDTIRE
jgi:hypothetical protein